MSTATESQFCTAATARCADARDYNVELRECCRGHIVEMVRVLAPMLNELRVTWWADYGTLLGAVRNPLTTWADYPWLPQEGRTTSGPAAGIIPHDKDADLGFMWYDLPKIRRLNIKLAKIGFYTHGLKIKRSAKNDTNVDLFGWHEKPNGILFRRGYAEVDSYKGRHFHKDTLFPLTTVEWEGLTLPAPRDPEAFLAMRYGPNWMTPVAANHDGVRR